jgi:hypothetical protein
MTPVTYRRHNCTRRHRTYATLAKCIWPRAVWIHGDGEYASVAYCRNTTVWLHPNLEQANASLAWIDHFGCGGRCSRDHKVIRLELPA